MTYLPTPAERNREALYAKLHARRPLPPERYEPMPAAHGGDDTKWPRPGVPDKGCLQALAVLAAGVVTSWAVLAAVAWAIWQAVT